MTARLRIDGAGRVVIPKPLRDELHLGAGDELHLEAQGERIVLRPVRPTMPLRKEHGIWVFRTGERLSAQVTDKVSAEVRTDRDRANLAGHR
jgi:AbrB family looped-hinge helix DNA binding protein